MLRAVLESSGGVVKRGFIGVGDEVEEAEGAEFRRFFGGNKLVSH